MSERDMLIIAIDLGAKPSTSVQMIARSHYGRPDFIVIDDPDLHRVTRELVSYAEVAVARVDLAESLIAMSTSIAGPLQAHREPLRRFDGGLFEGGYKQAGPRLKKRPSARCLRCGAIVPEGQRCPKCGGRRTH